MADARRMHIDGDWVDAQDGRVPEAKQIYINLA